MTETSAPVVQKAGSDMRMRKDAAYRPFFYKTLIVIGTLIGLLALWQLSGVLLLIFAAVLIAVILVSLSKMIARFSPLGQSWALLVTILLLAALFAALFYLFGSEIAAQIDTLSDLVPAAWAALRARIEASELARNVIGQLGSMVPGGGQLFSTFGTVLSGVTGVLSSAVLVIVGGVYLAVQPGLYVEGTLALVPPAARPRVRALFRTTGRALKLWLLGALGAMIIVGVVTGVGLWLLGVPSPLALGLIAGLLEFIPFAGPILSAIPALLIAAAQGTDMLIYTVLLYLLVQQIEGNLIQPIIQKRAVDLPPALTIFALIAISSVFGPLGLVLATPLTVVGYVAVKQLYIRDVLEEKTSIPGEK